VHAITATTTTAATSTTAVAAVAMLERHRLRRIVGALPRVRRRLDVRGDVDGGAANAARRGGARVLEGREGGGARLGRERRGERQQQRLGGKVVRAEQLQEAEQGRGIST